VFVEIRFISRISSKSGYLKYHRKERCERVLYGRPIQDNREEGGKGLNVLHKLRAGKRLIKRHAHFLTHSIHGIQVLK